jgi:hypothetical protein
MRGRVWGGHWSKSTDPAVVSAMDQIFTLFQSLGTPGAVVRELIRQGLAIPKRVMWGPQYGAVVFRPPTLSRVRAILRNPNFTDAFVFSKTHHHDSGRLRQDGTGPLKVGRRPREEWLIVRDHHEPYISWQQFEANQDRLRRNQSEKKSIPRNGPALLGRLLVCGHCHRAMRARYGNRGQGQVARPQYQCLQSEQNGRLRSCRTVSATSTDAPVVRAVLQTLAALTPQAIEEALAQEQQGYRQQQRQRVRAVAEAEAAVALAARRYQAVDPANTLVHTQLEHAYEEALRQRAQPQHELLATPLAPPPAVPDEGPSLLQTAADVQFIWSHPAVRDDERKAILRALLERIECHENTPGLLELTLYWKGGPVSTVHGYRITYSQEKVLSLWQVGAPAEEIAVSLNAEGWQTRAKTAWNAKAVGAVLYKHARTTDRWQQTQQRLCELAVEGLQGQALANRMNAEGWRTLTNNRWTWGTVAIELQVMKRTRRLPVVSLAGSTSLSQHP